MLYLMLGAERSAWPFGWGTSLDPWGTETAVLSHRRVSLQGDDRPAGAPGM